MTDKSQLYQNWMEGYKKAWENRDLQLVESLFTPDAAYSLSPFEHKYEGRKKILDYWEDVPIFQMNIHFNYDLISVQDNKGYAHCYGSFERFDNGSKIEMDGIFEIELNDEGRCKKLNQWFDERVNSPFE